MNSTERASHPSRNQVEFLLEFLEKHPNLAKGFPKVPSARDASRKAWEGLTLKLTSLGGCVKTWKQWTKYWADKKSAVKKKVALRYRVINETGCGFQSVVELSEVEERIVALMGGESFSIGDRHLEINPFPEPTSLSPSILSDNNAIPSLTIEKQHESSTVSLIDVDVFTPTVETPLWDVKLECVAETSYSSARPSMTHMVIESPQEAQTPPRVRPSSPIQSPTPSGSGKYPRRRQLDISGLQSHTASLFRQRPRHFRQSPPSQQQGQFVNITERFLKLEEQCLKLDEQRLKLEKQRLELDRCNYERTSVIFNNIAEGIKLLAEALSKKNV